MVRPARSKTYVGPSDCQRIPCSRRDIRKTIETTGGAEVNILVVGGAGYIGSHMVRLLDRRGHRVVILDNLSTGCRNAVTAGELVVGDMSDQLLVEQILCRPLNRSGHPFRGLCVGRRIGGRSSQVLPQQCRCDDRIAGRDAKDWRQENRVLQHLRDLRNPRFAAHFRNSGRRPP